MRTLLLAPLLALVPLAACSSTDLAMFNVAMAEANGTYWPDQSDSQRYDCASGNGYVMEYAGVSGGQGYVYFTSYARDGVSIEVSYDDGDFYTLDLGYGETSTTLYNHPGYGWNSSWAC